MAGVIYFMRQHPIVLYLAGGVGLHFIRQMSVYSAYEHHFTQFDKERKEEKERASSNE